MILDMHSHILPGVDDGSDSMETTIAMLKNAENDGTDCIIATPHYCYNYYTPEHDEILKISEELYRKMEKSNLNIKVLIGNEIYLDKYALDTYKNHIVSTLGDTSYILLELPFDTYPDYAPDLIYEFQILGLTPVIAHPERYRYVAEDTAVLNDFIKEGCLFQCNTSSIEGKSGNSDLKTAEKLLKSGIVNFLGSDAHSCRRRCTGLSKTLKILKSDYNSEYKNILRNMDSFLNGEIVEQSGEIITQKKFFDIFKRKR